MRCRRGELPLPDPGLHVVGGDDGGQRGPKQLGLLQHFGLHRSSDVLDVGCGLGRLAYELASHLDSDGSYSGLDIAPPAIDWLNANYAPRLPGFRFDLLDVHNERFRPEGSEQPEAVRFPFDDAQFDVACAFEVFMHLPLAGVANYLDEMARVLRSGGLAVITFMAIYPEEEEPRHAGRPFVHVGGGVHTRFPDRSGTSMGFRVELIRDMLTVAGLEEVASIKGQWHSPWVDLGNTPAHNCDLFAARRADR
ncbi:MAG: class I SAM-dependent methyltransferase [Actinomycetota bacterium]